VVEWIFSIHVEEWQSRQNERRRNTTQIRDKDEKLLTEKQMK